MADGIIKQAQYVKRGERLMGPDGQPRLVLGTTVGEDEMYRIVPTKGQPWVCNGAHVLTLVCTRPERTGEVRDIPLVDYLDPAVRMDRGKLKLFRVGVDFAAHPTLLPPYLAGLWLGDGSRAKAEITNKEPVIAAYCQEVAALYACTCTVTDNPEHHTQQIRFQRADGQRGIQAEGPSPLMQGFQQLLDEKRDKRIPPSYLQNSRQSRLALLAGLLDADGYVTNGCIEIVTKYAGLRDDLLYLCRSLGLAAYTTEKIATIKSLGFKGKYWRLNISGDFSAVPFLVRRIPPRRQIKNILHTGFTVVPLGRGPYCGFELDGDGRFLLGDFTVTHNSALGLSLMQHAIVQAHLRTLYVSLEMNANDLALRLLSAESGVPLRALRERQLDEGAWRQVLPAAERLCAGTNGAEPDVRCDHIIADISTYTIKQLRSDALRLHQEAPLRLIIVDYLQLMRPNQKGDNREQQVAQLSRDLKGLARELALPVVMLAQLNREAEHRGDHRPQLYDLRESGAVEQDCDVVMMLYREDLYTPNLPAEQKPVTELLIRKNRNGPTGMVKLFFLAEVTRFVSAAQASDWTPPSYEQEEFDV